MPQPSRKFTNDNLNIISYKDSPRVYSNQDLQDEHPPDILDDVEDNDTSSSPPDILDDESENPNIKAVPENAPTDWYKGFAESVASGKAFQPKRDALEWAKGAIDIPKTIGDIISAVGNKFHEKEAKPQTKEELYGELRNNLSKPFWTEGTNLGLNADTFARDTGQMTGQPLLTEGMIKAGPAAIRGIGHVAEPVGRIMRRHAPLTGMPVISPLAGRNLTRLERMGGRGIEAVGKRMQNVGKGKVTTIEGKVVDSKPPFEEGMELQDGQPIVVNREPVTVKTEPVKRGNTTYSSNHPSKPKIRPNGDGTFTDMNTGEIYDSFGKAVTPNATKSEIPKIDRNSPFFKKNRRY